VVTLLKYDDPVLARSGAGQYTTVGSGRAIRAALDDLFPPRRSSDTGNEFLQYVSATPATLSDVDKLQHDLDRMLRRRNAQKSVLDRNHAEVYGDFFDEIVRQVAIQCPERGRLLGQLRDEFRECQTALFSFRDSWAHDRKRNDELESAYKKVKADYKQIWDVARPKMLDLSARLRSAETRLREREDQLNAFLRAPGSSSGLAPGSSPGLVPPLPQVELPTDLAEACALIQQLMVALRKSHEDYDALVDFLREQVPPIPRTG
jgi:hypothetical protein